jgi:hypothetical protein
MVGSRSNFASLLPTDGGPGSSLSHVEFRGFPPRFQGKVDMMTVAKRVTSLCCTNDTSSDPIIRR